MPGWSRVAFSSSTIKLKKTKFVAVFGRNSAQMNADIILFLLKSKLNMPSTYFFETNQ